MIKLRLNMIGTGYVGLVTGACFAKNEDNHVICTDIDERKIELLKKCQMPIYEEGLEQLVREGLARGNLEFTTNIEYAVDKSLVNFICVGTPSLPDGSANLKQVESAARGIGRSMKEYKVIVDKSTVPLGTTRLVREWVEDELRKRNIAVDYDIVSCPEFLREGKAVDDFLKPDRVVVGTASERANKTIRNLFSTCVMNGRPIMSMNCPEGELTKYGSNAGRAMKISFANELTRIAETYAEQTGEELNALESIKAICADSMIGEKFMTPGPGFGGSCFPKDLRELEKTVKDLGVEAPIIQGILRSNQLHKEYLLNKIISAYDTTNGKTFGIWGLAFKAETDDIRESASLTIIEGLLDKGANIQCYDPQAINEAKKIFKERVIYSKDKYDAVKGADGLVVVTEWESFKTPNLELLRDTMNQLVIFDYRNLYAQRTRDVEPVEDKIRSMGFKYYGVGR